MPDSLAIRVSGLHKTYKNTQALRGLDFEIPKGAVTGFLGPNGAGKTTTFRSLLGLSKPDSGEIEVLGMRVPGELHLITKKVGCIIEEPGSDQGPLGTSQSPDCCGFPRVRTRANR